VHRIIQATTGPVLRLKRKTIEHLADCSLRLIEGAFESAGAASAIAYEATMALYDGVFGTSAALTANGDDAGIARVVEHVLDHLDEELNVTELADIAGFSRSHFSRVFAEHQGVSPASFVLQERMRRAARLLTGHAVLPIKEISAMTGFADPNYFAKVFHRYFGTSPTDFRETGMKSMIGTASP
jgi:transcriptional regulator GlxA family with amidase domain